jgi:hypothetical protein
MRLSWVTNQHARNPLLPRGHTNPREAFPGQVFQPVVKIPTMRCGEAPALEYLAFGGALGKPDHFGRLYTGKKILI